jgi:WD40 repeat protein
LLATGSIDGTVRLWDVVTGQCRCTLAGHRSWVNSITFSPDGAFLATGSSDGTVKLWDPATRRPRATLDVPEGEVRCVALSPDGRTVAAGIRYGFLKVWDVASRRERVTLRAHAGETWSLAFSAAGKTLFSGGGDWKQPGEVHLWDTASWRRDTLRHTGEVLCVAVAGKVLAAGSWDGTVKVWNVSGPRRPQVGDR